MTQNIPSAGWRGIMAALSAGFLAILAAAAGLGVYANGRLGDVQEDARAVGGHWLPTTRALGDISYLGQRFRVIEAAALLAPPQEKAAERKTLDALRGEIEAAFARAGRYASLAQERGELAAAQMAWRAYLALDERMLAAISEPGEVAVALYRSQMRNSIHDFQDAVKAAITHNVARADAAVQAGEAEGASAQRDLLAGFVAVAGLCALVGFALQRGIVRPIGGLTRAMKQLAEGATDVAIPGLTRRDEIGAMARASAVFKDAAQERRAALEREAAAQRTSADQARATAAEERDRSAQAQAHAIEGLGAGLRALADGDLGHGLAAGFPADYASLRDDFEQARGKLAAALRAVGSSADTIAREYRALRVGSDDLSARAERQAATLEQSSAALLEITETARGASDGAAAAHKVVAAACAEARRGGAVVGEAVAAMDGISKSAREIREITGLIDEIAFQTNLLALNAGVEAARAGEAGRGFAVVATEVRALAQRSADMAKRISDLISTSDRQVASGVGRVGATGEALARIGAEIERLDAIVDGIAKSGAEQAQALGEVNAAVQDMDQMTQRNAALARDSSAATQRVAEEIDALDRLMRQFRIDAEAPRRAA